MATQSQKVVVAGAGFLGSYIARELCQTSKHQVQLASRNPKTLRHKISSDPVLSSHPQILPPAMIDILDPKTLPEVFESAHTVVSLVGLLHGTPAEFDSVQWKGAENVARASRKAGARLVHVSAIGADSSSEIPYFRTKALAEHSIRDIVPDVTIIRPSLVFGPGDGFFVRFATLSRFMPFLPVFGGGLTKFQPVFAGDIARLVEMCTRDDEEIQKVTSGKIIEAGGPDVFTYREMMSLVAKHTKRKRPIISLPYAAGYAQGWMMEQLPTNILTLTRDQVEQLKYDNVAKDSMSSDENNLSPISFSEILKRHDSRGLGPSSAHVVLPSYL